MTKQQTKNLPTEIPTLQTERLILRPFALTDASDVQRMAGTHEVAKMTASIPHPYEDGMAEEWIGKHVENFREHSGLNLAITLAETGELLGAIGLMGIDPNNQRAELGYWIGPEHWSNGYCTEAARQVVRYGFDSLDLHRITSHHLDANPASGRVMEKIGMTHEGTLRKHWKKADVFHDCPCYGILAGEKMNGPVKR